MHTRPTNQSEVMMQGGGAGLFRVIADSSEGAGNAWWRVVTPCPPYAGSRRFLALRAVFS